ncbi:MAG: hypothetical protein H6708_19390 [Kofleriaceae bacterium]|nr:hypothetical protein [Myxococcales bacterium]MCB9562572.1 hypothetical protein [Kofleriaceae bacterium]
MTTTTRRAHLRPALLIGAAVLSTAALSAPARAESAPPSATEVTQHASPAGRGATARTYVGTGVVLAGPNQGAMGDVDLGVRAVGPVWVRARASGGWSGVTLTGSPQRAWAVLGGAEVRGCAGPTVCFHLGVDAGFETGGEQAGSWDLGPGDVARWRGAVIEPRLGVEIGSRAVAFRLTGGVRTFVPFAGSEGTGGGLGGSEDVRTGGTVEVGVIARF